MWLFGHVGPGTAAIQKLKPQLPFGVVVVGTILPDLIDKPLYYGLRFLTGAGQEGVSFVTCTRTVGHTGLFLGAISVAYLWKKKPALLALALGVATHLTLDMFQDLVFLTQVPWDEKSAVIAASFPFFRPHFGAMPVATLREHLSAITVNPHLVWTELLGLGLFTYAAWRNRSTSRRSKSDR